MARGATDFKAGDRVQLSELGKSRMRRMKASTGTVVNATKRAINTGQSIDVLFDGNKQVTRVHWSYVELEAEAIADLDTQR